MASPVTLRTFVRDSDREEVRRVVASTGFFHDYEVAIAVELVEERLAKGPASGYHFFFAEQDGRVVGYACYGPIACTLHSYDLFWIVVEQERRGQGIGRRLLAETEKAIAALGGRRIYAETSSRPLYAPTRAFYESSGFRAEAVLADFYAPGDDKVVFVKTVAPGPGA